MFFNSIKTALFLSKEYIVNFNKWTSALIIFVMFLTFLNLTVVKGFLIGLIVGSEEGYRNNYSGDVVIRPTNEYDYIKNSQSIINGLVNSDLVESFSPRYRSVVTVKEDYRDISSSHKKKDAGINLPIVGIDVRREKMVTGFGEEFLEGSHLSHNDSKGILIGYAALAQYSPFAEENFVLKNTTVGDRVLLEFSNDIRREYIVRGIFKIKEQNFDLSIVMNGNELKNITNLVGGDVDEIAIKAEDGVTPERLKEELLGLVSTNGRVTTYFEAIGVFINDIKTTFSIIGNLIGAISLIVASITIFIIIFITALTKSRSIGVLKGIGLTSLSIELSYVLLAIFYAFTGVLLGVLLLAFVLKPYFDANPIDFPFSDGILFVTFWGTIRDIGIIFFVTIFAGYWPVRIITKKNTLDSILGR